MYGETERFQEYRIDLRLNLPIGFTKGLPEIRNIFRRETLLKCLIDLFTDTAAILHLLDLRSIMGCPGGTRSVFARFSGEKRTSMYISREKGDHYYIQTLHNNLFFP